MNLRPVYVDRAFRDYVFEVYPGPRRNRQYPQLLQAVFFPQRRDRDTDAPVLPLALLAEVEDKSDQLASRHYCSKPLLERYFRDTGHYFDLTRENYQLRQARTVANLRLPPGLEEALAYEVQTIPREPVDFVTGR